MRIRTLVGCLVRVILFGTPLAGAMPSVDRP